MRVVECYVLSWSFESNSSKIVDPLSKHILPFASSGLLGQLTQRVVFTSQMLIVVIGPFAGGLLGAYYGALKFNKASWKYIVYGIYTRGLQIFIY